MTFNFLRFSLVVCNLKILKGIVQQYERSLHFRVSMFYSCFFATTSKKARLIRNESYHRIIRFKVYLVTFV